MTTVQVYIRDRDTDYYMNILKEMREYYERRVDEAFHGKSFNWDYSRGRRRRVKRPDVNNSYVFREALKDWWMKLKYEVEEEIEYEPGAKRKEKPRKSWRR